MQYLDFRQNLFVPIQERESLIIPVQRGCSYGNCIFCPLRDDFFKIYSLDYIVEDLKEIRYLGVKYKRAFLSGHNTLGLWTNYLVRILQMIREQLPFVNEISLSSNIPEILEKSDEELLELKAFGLKEIHICLSTASDIVLDFMKKGYNSKDIEKALEKLEKLDIDYSVFYIPGLGGKEYSHEHYMESSQLISKYHPKSIWSAGLVVWNHTPLKEEVRNGNFIPLRQMETAEEEIYFLERLNMKEDTQYINTNYMNFYSLTGDLPKEKNRLRSLLMKLFRQDDDIISK